MYLSLLCIFRIIHFPLLNVSLETCAWSNICQIFKQQNIYIGILLWSTENNIYAVKVSLFNLSDLFLIEYFKFY